MDWISIILPIAGVALGWGFSELSNIIGDRRKDNRKLKRLLFYLLELRYYFSKELNLNKDLDEYLTVAKEKLISEFGEEFDLGFEIFKPLIEHAIKSSDEGSNKYEYLEQNIDEVIIELAEILPVIAHDLSGRHSIKQRLKKSEDYLAEFTEIFSEAEIDLKSVIKPMLEDELLIDIDVSIEIISKMINRGTYLDAKDAIKEMDERDDSDIESYLDNYIDNVKDLIEKSL